MNRVLLNFAISLIFGIVLSSNITLALVFAIALLFLYLISFVKLKRHFMLTIIIGFIVGVILHSFAPTYIDSEIYKYVNKPSQCELVVTGVPSSNDGYAKFEAVVQNINGENTDEKVLVYVYDAKNIEVNNRITFNKIKFKLPADKRNPGGFDYRTYLSGKGIFFTATANCSDILKSEPATMNIKAYATKINVKLTKIIDKKFSVGNGGVLKALLLGNKNDVDDEIMGYFRDSGLSHTMAVSGLHLAIIVMLLNMFIKRFNRWIRFFISFALVLGFTIITGMPVSVIRAAIMLLFLQLADALYIEGDSLTNLSLAALVVLIPNPNAVHDIGFTMSFSATLGILCLSTRIKNLIPESIPSTIRESISITLAAQVGTLPFSAMYFGQLSVLAIISNLLIVVLLPLIYMVGIPAVLTGVAPLISIAEFLLSCLTKWADLCSNLPGQMQYIPINSIVIIGLFMFSIIAMLTSVIKNKKIAAWLLAFSITVSLVGGIIETRTVKGTEISFLNVGQADCALVRSKDTAILIDTATEYMGEAEISGYLLRNGISHLDGIFISHFDADHCGGIYEILKVVGVDAVFVPDTIDVGEGQYELIKYLDENEIKMFGLKKGDKVEFENIKISVLHPFENTVKDGNNNASLAFRVDNKDVSALFLGDLQKDSTLENCDTDILKVSHHGSKNGTSESLLLKNTPEIAVISLGENNSYGFPHSELTERLNKFTDKIYRTDLNKTIVIKCNNKNYEVETMRQVI